MCTISDNHLSVTEVKAKVADETKYIEETKETMDKNSKKLAEIVQDIDGIHTGKKIQYTFHISMYIHTYNT